MRPAAGAARATAHLPGHLYEGQHAARDAARGAARGTNRPPHALSDRLHPRAGFSAGEHFKTTMLKRSPVVPTLPS
eukprot:5937627-Alexandrium_andersonii.AAC.1